MTLSTRNPQQFSAQAHERYFKGTCADGTCRNGIIAVPLLSTAGTSSSFPRCSHNSKTGAFASLQAAAIDAFGEVKLEGHTSSSVTTKGIDRYQAATFPTPTCIKFEPAGGDPATLGSSTATSGGPTAPPVRLCRPPRDLPLPATARHCVRATCLCLTDERLGALHDFCTEDEIEALKVSLNAPK